MVGWTLLFGYVGSMAMYAFAFGAFAVELLPALALPGIPLRPAVSVAAVAGVVALNLAGARATGSAEDVMVGLKVAILALFGLGGVAYSTWFGGAPISLGLDQVMFYHLYRSEPRTFYTVLVVAAAVVLVEVVYFEREWFEEEIDEFESAALPDG